MRVQTQVLSPGVQDCEEADLGAEMLGIARDGQQGLRGDAEQHPVDLLLVIESEGGNLSRQREYDVEIRDRQ